MGELCENGWTDPDVVWGFELCESKNHVLDIGVKIGQSRSQPQGITSQQCGLFYNKFKKFVEVSDQMKPAFVAEWLTHSAGHVQ